MTKSLFERGYSRLYLHLKKSQKVDTRGTVQRKRILSMTPGKVICIACGYFSSEHCE